MPSRRRAHVIRITYMRVHLSTPQHNKPTQTPFLTMAKSPRRAARCRRPAPSRALRSVPRSSSSFSPRTSPAWCRWCFGLLSVWVSDGGGEVVYGVCRLFFLYIRPPTHIYTHIYICIYTYIHIPHLDDALHGVLPQLQGPQVFFDRGVAPAIEWLSEGEGWG